MPKPAKSAASLLGDLSASLLSVTLAVQNLEKDNLALREELELLRASSKTLSYESESPRVDGAQPDLPLALSDSCQLRVSDSWKVDELSDEIGSDPPQPLEVAVRATASFLQELPQHACPSTRQQAFAKSGSKSQAMTTFFGGVDENALVDEKRNAERAQLQKLLVDLDPDKKGRWATQELTFDFCKSVLVAHGKHECDEEILADVLEKLQDHLSPGEVPLALQLLDMTSIKEIEDTFGIDSSEDVMNLQEAVLWDVHNQLFGQARAVQEIGADGKFCSRVLRFLANESRLSLVEHSGLLLVFLNTIALGLSTDIARGWAGWDVISAFFSVAFLIEVVLRMRFSGGARNFFLNSPTRAWNIFEAAIVCLTLLDLFTLILASQSEHMGARLVMVCRVMRLVRLTRIARLARVGVLHELAYMLRGIEAGISTLIWALILLLMICYVGAIILTQTLGRDHPPDFKPYADVHFSTLISSMFTCFRCCVGDCSSFDGRPIGVLLQEHFGILSVLLYSACIMGVSFGLFNVMTASFVQSSMRAARFSDIERRRVLQKERELVSKKTAVLVDRVRDIFIIQDETRGSCTSLAELRVTRDMFGKFLRDAEVQHWLEDMGCDDVMRGELFDRIDKDGNGSVEATELVIGIVDLLRGRFDSLQTVVTLVRSIQTRLVHLEALVVLGHQAAEEHASPTVSQ